MGTLRSRFILSHILPVLVVVPLVGAALIYLLQTQLLLNNLADGLTQQAQIVAEELNRRPDIWQDPEQAQAFVHGLALLSSGNLSLLRPDGELWATSNPAWHDNLGQAISWQGFNEARSGDESVLVFYEWRQPRAEVLVPVRNINRQLVGMVGVTQTLEGVAAEFERLRWLVAAIVGLELLLGIGLAVYLGRRLERPITGVAEAVVGLAEGERIAPLAEEGPLELQRLSAAVNSLAERLRLLEETRRQLLANIVHELGRPLGAMRSAVHVVRQGAGPDTATGQELLAGIENEIERMQPLLDDLAELHGQVSGQLQLKRRPVALAGWLPALLQPWRAAAADKGLDWLAEIGAGLPVAEIDPKRVGQAAGNLLSNAIKYTPAGGQVSVRAGADDGAFWIEVADSGPGIAAGEQARVFEPFYRSQQLSRFPQGLGLGLTIARDVARAHGGRLSLESRPGQGSRFTLWLPLGVAEPPQAADLRQVSRDAAPA
ncbi:MAG: sensor histidine kinase [Candidatus Promineifilaceae bacterium]